MIRRILFVTLCCFIATVWGCTKHEVELKPVEIKPIHITLDVNLKVDRALDNFFGDIDAAEDKLKKGEK